MQLYRLPSSYSCILRLRIFLILSPSSVHSALSEHLIGIRNCVKHLIAFRNFSRLATLKIRSSCPSSKENFSINRRRVIFRSAALFDDQSRFNNAWIRSSIASFSLLFTGCCRKPRRQGCVTVTISVRPSRREFWLKPVAGNWFPFQTRKLDKRERCGGGEWAAVRANIARLLCENAGQLLIGISPAACWWGPRGCEIFAKSTKNLRRRSGRDLLHHGAPLRSLMRSRAVQSSEIRVLSLRTWSVKMIKLLYRIQLCKSWIYDEMTCIKVTNH